MKFQAITAVLIQYFVAVEPANIRLYDFRSTKFIPNSWYNYTGRQALSHYSCKIAIKPIFYLSNFGLMPQTAYLQSLCTFRILIIKPIIKPISNQFSLKILNFKIHSNPFRCLEPKPSLIFFCFLNRL